MTTLGEKLKNLRVSKGLKQIQTATLFSVSRSVYSKWEIDYAVPSLEDLVTIADFYGVTADYLLNRKTVYADEETRLLDIFYQLNDDGKEQILKLAIALNQSGLYKKCDTTGFLQESV